MNMKYCVASRTMVSKRLGMPGYLLIPDLLAVTKMIKNTRTSMTGGCGVECEARQISRVK